MGRGSSREHSTRSTTRWWRHSFVVLFLATTGVLSFPAGIEARGHSHHHREVSTANLCRSTDFPAACSGVAKLLKNKEGPTALVRLSIWAAMSKALKAGWEVHSRLASRGPHVDKRERSSLSTCRQNYDSALTDLRTALKYLKTRDTGTVTSHLSAAIADVGSCDDSYAESGMVSPTAQLSELIRRHASNSIVLVGRINKSHGRLVG